MTGPAMNPDSDELAALLALDALEPDEQADAELRFGTFPGAWSAAAGRLAEDAATPAPPDLRAAVLGHALGRRPAGRPLEAVALCTPAEAFRRTIADLHALATSLSDDEWNRPAHDEHGLARDVLAHLVGIERLLVRWIDGDPDAPVLPDHVAATVDVVARLHDVPMAEVIEAWHAGALAVADGLEAAGSNGLTWLWSSWTPFAAHEVAPLGVSRCAKMRASEPLR